jgi:tetratricopeptide (TPR) repeat protein
MTKYKKCLLAVATLAVGTLSHPAVAAEYSSVPEAMLALIDTAAPKYGTPECQAMREEASKFRVLYATGAVPANGVMGAYMAASFAAEEERRQKRLADRFIEACDDVAFIPYYQWRSQLGDEDATNALGLAYEHKQDWALAIQSYQTGIDRGNATAEARLGILYMRGNGVPQDRARAVSMWLHAAGDGSNEARVNLGQMYAADQDYAKANEWFLKAARRRGGGGAYFLGVASEQGLGMERNDVAAFGWYSVAWHLNYPGAAEKRNAVAARLRKWQMDKMLKNINQCLHFNRCEM